MPVLIQEEKNVWSMLGGGDWPRSLKSNGAQVHMQVMSELHRAMPSEAVYFAIREFINLNERGQTLSRVIFENGRPPSND